MCDFVVIYIGIYYKNFIMWRLYVSIIYISKIFGKINMFNYNRIIIEIVV